MKATKPRFIRQPFARHPLSLAVSALAAGCITSPVLAAGLTGSYDNVEEVFVEGKAVAGLSGHAESASVGTVTMEQIKFRPLTRPAEVLEAVPGMIITQHSGEGKANQYFLRGFNLDHGTDFSNFVDGMPVNQVSHGHGQGYTDLNFLIPELVESVTYYKGPYYAQTGDFSSAGSANIRYAFGLDKNLLKATLGRWGYQRALAVINPELSSDNQDLMLAGETVRYDGPWDTEQNIKKNNAVVKFKQGDRKQGFGISAMYYENTWSSTDQIPDRAIAQNGLYSDLDPSTGGDTHRYSLSFDQWGQLGEGNYKANVYWIDYGLELATNATYFLENATGDKFTQFDERDTFGGSFSWKRELNSAHDLELGAHIRYDDIAKVGFVPATAADRELNSIRELSYGLYASLHSQWNDWFKTTLGARYDYFDFDVARYSQSDPFSQEGEDSDGYISPKLSLAFGPWANTEYFINIGQSLHSNDGRGVIKDNKVDPAAKSTGYELGLRTAPAAGLELSAAFFVLDLDSELVFVGDDGTTEARDATRRKGLEIGVFYDVNDWLNIDIDAAISQARFDEVQKEGNAILGDHVPDAMEQVFSIAAVMDFDSGYYGGIRARYFGPRDLNEDGSKQSDSTFVVNANAGYRFNNGVNLGLELLNLLDSDDDDITYYYESRIEPEETPPDLNNPNQQAKEDFHRHPVEPRNIRLTVSYEF